jgi:anaerobic ribonucleoside-triphosphate reductase activating protein
VSDLLAAMDPWLEQADGITVTGGEPFEQAEGLRCLLSGIRQRTAADILVFTGYRLEDIDHSVCSMPGLIDGLLAGPYLPEAGQTKALRGSDNQQLHLLTEVGRSMYGELDTQGPSSRLDMMMSGDGDVYFAGIPAPGDFSTLQDRLEQAGHMISTSADRRPA